jgi:L-malate glycosyltransferase
MESQSIMVLTTTGSWGGAENVVAQTTAHLHRLGYRVRLAILSDGDGTLFNIAKDDIGLDAVSFHAAKRSPWRAMELLPLMDEEPPGLIIAHLFHSYMTARVLGRMMRRIPVISVLHSSGQGRGRSFLDRLTLGFTEYYVIVSEDGAKYAREALGVPGRKLRMIPAGVDIEGLRHPKVSREEMRKSFGFAEGDFVVGCVARFHPVKDHETLLSAFKILRQRIPHAKLLLAGKGDELPKIRASAQDKGLLGDVVFAGFRRDLPELYAAMDAACLTSLSEGMGITLLEAMAAGVPIAATSAPGISALLRQRENALLAPVGDAAGIASALEAIATQPELANQLTASATEEVEAKYSQTIFLGQYQALVEDIIGPALPFAR